MERTFRIFRFNPEKDRQPRYDTFTVAVQDGWTILDALNEIKWRQDGTLSYRRSCRHGICGSCAMMINGKNELACEKQISTLKGEITVAPLKGFPIVRDLLIDQEHFFENLRLVRPWLIARTSPPTDKERLQSPGDRARFDDTTKCMLCAACTTSCPSFWADKDYVGPAAIVNAHRFMFDSRDQGAARRLSLLASRDGVWRCRTILNCVTACPRDIDVSRAIQEVKKKIATGRAVYDR